MSRAFDSFEIPRVECFFGGLKSAIVTCPSIFL